MSSGTYHGPYFFWKNGEAPMDGSCGAPSWDCDTISGECNFLMGSKGKYKHKETCSDECEKIVIHHYPELKDRLCKSGKCIMVEEGTEGAMTPKECERKCGKKSNKNWRCDKFVGCVRTRNNKGKFHSKKECKRKCSIFAPWEILLFVLLVIIIVILITKSLLPKQK